MFWVGRNEKLVIVRKIVCFGWDCKLSVMRNALDSIVQYVRTLEVFFNLSERRRLSVIVSIQLTSIIN